MKIITANNGKRTLKLSKYEWENIGIKTGWIKISDMTKISEDWELSMKINNIKEKCLNFLGKMGNDNYATFKTIQLFEQLIKDDAYVTEFWEHYLYREKLEDWLMNNSNNFEAIKKFFTDSGVPGQYDFKDEEYIGRQY